MSQSQQKPANINIMGPSKGLFGKPNPNKKNLEVDPESIDLKPGDVGFYEPDLDWG